MVYVIDNTFSLLPHRTELFAAYSKLKSRHGSTPNVRLAAIKNGYPGNAARTRQEVMKGIQGSLILNFVPPDRFRDDVVRSKITSRDASELFYPALEEAGNMIRRECPAGVDLGAKPWCTRKVIFALGDGDPGVTLRDYFSADDVHLPDKALSALAGASIVVNTICIGYDCTREMAQCDGATDPRAYGPSNHDGQLQICKGDFKGTKMVAIGYDGQEIMRDIARRGAGRYYGIIP